MSPRGLLRGAAPVAALFALALPAAAGVWVGASDPAFAYDGRLDTADPQGPVIIWQSSDVAIDFTGTSLGLRFADATGESFFDLTVDGRASIVAARRGGPTFIAYPGALDPGRHHLDLRKRSEASVGTVRFLGIELADGSGALRPTPPAYRLKMAFFGDSITAGACDEDGPEDQWSDHSTHDANLSYAAVTAAGFGADLRNISVSGMGVAIGWVPVLAGHIWDRTYPREDSPRADLASWVPDVIFVNYGENDDSYPRRHNLPFPAAYTPGYVALVHDIRATYPKAQVVLLRGGMYGGAKSKPLAAAWTAAVTQLEAADASVHHYVFQHWSETHPRVADHAALAAELSSWLKDQAFMRAYVPEARPQAALRLRFLVPGLM